MLSTAISEFRKRYDTFEDAYRSYTDQYGDHSVKAYPPYKISGTIDPVIIILGRTTPLFYRDSRKIISGSVGSVTIERGNVYILGRREPPDSKLVGWSLAGETELEQYDSRVRVIPSRIHASIISNDDNEIYFSDLGSTSGSILAGESSKPEPFVTLYATSAVDIHKIAIETKYAEIKKRES
jgi:pSer/pThr/pTyr-binding forkhead associated (FHA) protein